MVTDLHKMCPKASTRASASVCVRTCVCACLHMDTWNGRWIWALCNIFIPNIVVDIKKIYSICSRSLSEFFLYLKSKEWRAVIFWSHQISQLAAFSLKYLYPFTLALQPFEPSAFPWSFPSNYSITSLFIIVVVALLCLIKCLNYQHFLTTLIFHAFIFHLSIWIPHHCLLHSSVHPPPAPCLKGMFICVIFPPLALFQIHTELHSIQKILWDFS